MNTAAGEHHLVHVRQTNGRTDEPLPLSLSNIWSGVLLVLPTGEATTLCEFPSASSSLLHDWTRTVRARLSHFEERLRDERRGDRLLFTWPTLARLLRRSAEEEAEVQLFDGSSGVQSERWE